MKRILTFILVVTLVASATLVFTACSNCKEHVDADKNAVCDICGEAIDPSLMVPKDYLKYSNDDGAVYSALQKYGDLEGLTYSSNSGDLLLLYGGNSDEGKTKYLALNVETGNVVMTLKWEKADEKVHSSVSLSNGFIIKTTADESEEEKKYLTSVYTSLGEEVASRTSDSGYANYPESLGSNFYLFDGKIYEYKDGTATFIKEKGLGSVPTIDVVTDKYVYDINSSSVFVYDRDFNLAASYELPDNAYGGGNFLLLQNGNVSIQYFARLPEDAAEFDVFYSGMKLDVYTYILNPENNEKTEKELDFLIGKITNVNTVAESNPDGIVFDYIVNLASVNRIVNTIISVNDPEALNLDNDLNVISYAAKEVPSQTKLAVPVAENRFEVVDKAEKTYLVDGDGKLIGEVSDADFKNGYYICGGKYYDTNLKEVLDLNNSEYSLMDGTTNRAIYRKSTQSGSETKYEYYSFNGGEMKLLDIESVANSFNWYTEYFTYEVTDQTNQKRVRVFCNKLGEEIGRFDITSTSSRVNTSVYGNIIFITYTHKNAENVSVTEYFISKKA